MQEIMYIYLKDYTKTQSLPVEEELYAVDGFSTLGELLDKLGYKHHYAVVNGSFKPHSYVLNHGDVVVLVPALSGG
jgi:molybdopterin converting factor small subunit